jgi:hypothetical protein
MNDKPDNLRLATVGCGQIATSICKRFATSLGQHLWARAISIRNRPTRRPGGLEYQKRLTVRSECWRKRGPIRWLTHAIPGMQGKVLASHH